MKLGCNATIGGIAGLLKDRYKDHATFVCVIFACPQQSTHVTTAAGPA
jgi:hypothetical protein